MTTRDVHESSRTFAERVGAHAVLATVRSTETVSSALRAVTLTHPDAPFLAGVPGNDVMIKLPTDAHIARRRYSVRAADGDSLTLWMSTDHDGPGSRWAQELRAGDDVDLIGPRGKIPVRPDVPWHLFVGDTTSIGAFCRMAEAVTEGKVALIVEVESVTDFVAPLVAKGVQAFAMMVERHGAAPTDPSPILTALAAHHLPAGDGHAYVFGELTRGQAVAAALRDRGLSSDQISLKAFWRSGVGNADHGEPPKAD